MTINTDYAQYQALALINELAKAQETKAITEIVKPFPSEATSTPKGDK